MELWVPNLASFFRGKVVLDLGAGTGRHGILIAREVKTATVVSLDIVHQRLRAGVAQAAKLKSLSLVCGDVFALPFGDASFDCIVATSS
jgi:ubiquinone/menaquinone biosynthesis C-methylase UbiE